MHHQQLAARMVCSWKLVKAYQRTRQSAYICPPAPHVIEAFNHKVNHDSHKELGTQERAVLQYARALQYVSYCNDERYKDHIAPAVKAFWDEVAKPFGSRALRNLDLSHVVGRAMHPNRTAKIPDYGVRDHIALVCGPFFGSVETRSQYEARRRRREEERGRAGASSGHRSPSRGPKRSHERDREPPTPKASRARSKHRSCSRKRALSRTPWGGSPRDSSSSRGRKLPTPPQPSHVEKCQRGLGPRTQPAQMLWRLPSLHHCHGKSGCKKRKTSKRDTPLLEEIPSPVRLPHVWRAVASVTFRWLKKALSKATPMLLWRRK